MSHAMNQTAGQAPTPATGATTLLQVDHLTMRFGGLTAIDDLSLAVKAGRITAIIGPNGAGKTTLFNCLTGFYKPTTGSVRLHHPRRGEIRLETLPSHRVARDAQVVRTFQNIRLFPKMTVLENLVVAQHNVLQAASKFSLAGLVGLPGYRRAEQEALATAERWLERLGLVAFADVPAGDLPYGTQRRIEIARALCVNPILLCLDEPAAGLNPKESAELNSLLLDLSRNLGIAVLLIEHDMSVVMNVSDHICVINYGRKIAEGTPREIQHDPHVIKAYLGEDDPELDPGHDHAGAPATAPAGLTTAIPDALAAPASLATPAAGRKEIAQ